MDKANEVNLFITSNLRVPLTTCSQLCNVWSSLLSSITDVEDGSVRIDALTCLNRTTLDIIGLAGFGYSFDTLSSGIGEEATNEMDLAFRRLFSAAQGQTISNILSMLFPFLRHVVRGLYNIVCHLPNIS